MTTPRVEFCGEVYPLTADSPLTIGRGGELAIDDNPYLHRLFLEVRIADGMLWLTNVGRQLSATVADGDGLMQAWLAPGARLPLVFAKTVVWFTAGPTTYELDVFAGDAAFQASEFQNVDVGSTTIGRMSLTPDQRLLIVALAEKVLRRTGTGTSAIPSSAQAAARLGWAVTKFNRKLDNVCQKLEKTGVRGLHGDAEKLASSRRARLVEYAVSTRIVTSEDLMLLDSVTRGTGDDE